MSRARLLPALLLLALLGVLGGEGLPQAPPATGLAPAGSPCDDPQVQAQFKRLKKEVKRLIAERQRQGCDTTRAQALREQATGLRMAGRCGKALKALEAARLEAEQARPLQSAAQLAAAAQRYGPLAVRFFGLKERQDELLRAQGYLGAQALPGLSALQTRLGAAGGLLADYEAAFHAAYTGTQTTAQLARMESTARALDAELAEAERPCATALAAVAAKGEKSARRRELEALVAPQAPLRPGERLSKAQVAQHVIFGSARLPAPELRPLIAPLGFEFVNVEARVGRGAQPDLAALDAQVREAAALGCKAEVFVSLCPEAAAPGAGWHDQTSAPIDIWDAALRARLKGHLKLFGQHLKDNPAVLCYELWNEPTLPAFKPETVVSGPALAAFRDYLTASYHTPAALNRAWGTSYGAISEAQVQGPAARQEFQLFRARSLAELGGELCAALQQADPNHPVMPQVYEWPAKRGVDAFAWAEQGWDIYSQHETGGGLPGQWNNLAQVYGLARFGGRPLWNEEYVWNAPEAGEAYKANSAAGLLRAEGEMRGAAAARRNLWQQLAWGRRGFSFYSPDESWTDWENSLLDRYHGYRILRRSAAVVPVLGERARRLSALLASTQVAQPEIGVVRSFASELGTRPGKAVRKQGYLAERLLVRACLPYMVMPDEAIADGREQLSSYSVLVLPMTSHLPPEAARRLMEWTERGGTLVALGVPGVYDGLGRPGTLASRLLGAGRWSYLPGHGPKHWRWTLEGAGLKPKAAFGEGREVEVRRGQGRALIFTASLFDGGEGARQAFINEVSAALKRQTIQVVPTGTVEAVLRRDDAGHDYLFLINLDAGAPAEAVLRLRRPVKCIYDLSVEGLPALPRVARQGYSEARVWLAAGDAAVLALD